jgi:hypothetical protein
MIFLLTKGCTPETLFAINPISRLITISIINTIITRSVKTDRFSGVKGFQFEIGTP